MTQAVYNIGGRHIPYCSGLWQKGKAMLRRQAAFWISIPCNKE